MPKAPTPNNSMDAAFERSFFRWAKAEPEVSPEAYASLDAAISWCGANGTDSDGSPLYPGHRLLAVVALTTFLGQLEQPFALCGSPIGRLLLSALVVAGHTREFGVCLRTQRGEHTESFDLTTRSLDNLIVQPQARLGDYLVDFLVTQQSTVPDFEHRRTLADGMTIPGYMEVTKHLIVECDGHDFHDRTKEQASKDRARDRLLQSLGYRVYRYTGSDLWRDVFTAASEVLTALNDEVYPRPTAQ